MVGGAVGPGASECTVFPVVGTLERCGPGTVHETAGETDLTGADGNGGTRK